jgi:hypothetical protein
MVTNISILPTTRLLKLHRLWCDTLMRPDAATAGCDLYRPNQINQPAGIKPNCEVR